MPAATATTEEQPALALGVLSVFFGLVLFSTVVGVLYANFLLFQDYAIMLLWATVLAIGLRRVKAFIVLSAASDWSAGVKAAFLARPAVNCFLGVSWLLALCSSFGAVGVLSFHTAFVAAAAGYVYLLEHGVSIHQRCCGCSNAVAGTLVLLVGGFAIMSLVTIFFVLKCTEEGADAVSAMRNWASGVAHDHAADNPDSALWLNVHTVMEMEQVQAGISQAQAYVNATLDSLSGYGGEGLVKLVRDCYNASGGDARHILDCLWGEWSVSDMASKAWEDLQTFNLTALVMQSGLNILSVATRAVTVLVSFLGLLLTRGSEVVTCVVMLWYLLSSQNDWLVDGVRTVMPMASRPRQEAVAHQLTIIVEVCFLFAVVCFL
jgi:hypothetical protein